MKITYENGCMVIEHNSGHIDRYDEQHLLNIVSRTEKRKAAIEREIADINKHIESVKISLQSPELLGS